MNDNLLIIKAVHFQADTPAWPTAALDDDSLTHEPACNDACTQTDTKMKKSCKVMWNKQNLSKGFKKGPGERKEKEKL